MESTATRQRIGAELLIVGLVVLLGLTVAAPVVLGMAQAADLVYGPNWLWLITYCGSLAAYVVTSVLTETPRRSTALTAFVLHELLAIASVLLLRDGLGVVAVVLVFGAALSCYVLPRWATVLVVAVNTVVVGVASMQHDLMEALVGASFYLAIQVVSVVTVTIWIAQEQSQKRLAEAHTELAATAALLERSAKDEERLRISRDLHDVVGHQLTALTLELEIASHQADEPAQEHVLRARGIAKDLLEDVREAVSQQRDEEGSLTAALQRATEGVTRPTVRLSVDDAIVAGTDLTTLLVRATQEVVTNTIRHANGARILRIDVGRDGDSGSVLFRASDDGWAPRDLTLGNGLRGMRERAEALGGRTEFSRGSDGGFHVRVEVPE